MRIDPKNTVVNPVVAKAVRDSSPSVSRDDKPSTVVTVSSAAAAASASKAPAETSEAKVARLREAIQNGEYKVDLDALAARICEDEILGRGNS